MSLPRPAVASLLAAALLVPAGTAHAHSGVKKLRPGKGASVSRNVSKVSVTFTAPVRQGKLSVRTASGKKAWKGSARLTAGKRVLSVGLMDLRSGTYEATYKILNGDGHVQSSSWTFRVR